MLLYKLKDKLNLGKYKNNILQYAIDINPSYIEWLRANAKNNFSMDEISQAYLADKLAVFAINNMNKHLNKRYKR